jgi:peptidoglycan/LPS O-acetylase OafA/YrhL
MNQDRSDALSILLDLMRFVAASLVVMEHLSSRLLMGYGDLQGHGMLINALYLSNLLGGPSVIIFFVLSGFFISRSLLSQFDVSHNWLPHYFLNRLTRLYIVLIPALLLTFALDIIASFYGYATIHLDTATLLGNLFFIQTIIVRQYGSNGPLWSLSNEFWYYMIFPLLFLSATSYHYIMRIIYILSALLLLRFIGIYKSEYFICWLAGAVLSIRSIKYVKAPKVLLVLSAFILIIAVIFRPMMDRQRLGFDFHPPVLFIDVCISMSVAIFIYLMSGCLNKKACLVNRRVDNMIQRCASFSFSMYLIHYPLVNLGYWYAKSKGFRELYPSAGSFMLEISLVIAICLISYLFSLVTERHTAAAKIAMIKVYYDARGRYRPPRVIRD